MSAVREVASGGDFVSIRARRVGFVINTKGPANDFWTPVAILHEAGCSALGAAGPDHKLFTEQYYMAVDWLTRERTDNWESCGRCAPKPSRAELQTVREQRAVAFLVNNKSAWGGMSKLHTATCHAAAAAFNRLEEFTDYETAVAWLNANGGQENVTWSACGICYPRPLRAGPSTATSRAGDSYLVNDKSTYGVMSVVHEAGCRAAAMTSGLKPFGDFESAVVWLKAHVGAEGAFWKRCGICQPGPSLYRPPAPPARSPTPPSHGPTATPQPPHVPPIPPAVPVAPAPPRAGVGDQQVRALQDKVVALEAERDAAERHAVEADRRAVEAGNEATQVRAVLASTSAEISGIREDLEALRAHVTETDAAFELVTKERDYLRAALTRTESKLADAEVRAGEAESEARNLRGRVDVGDDREYAELSIVSVADVLMAEGLVSGTLGLRVLDDMQVAAPSNATLLEYRAIVLSANGSDAEALATFERLGEPSTSRGRVAFVLSSFRLDRPVPRDEWIVAVDWQEQDAAPLLRGGLSRMSVKRTVGLLRQLQASLKPSQLRELLADQYERDLADDELMPLLDFWEAADPVGASQRFCATARQRPLMGGAWLDDALDRVVMRQPDDDDAPMIIASRLAGMEPEAAANRALEVASLLQGTMSPRFRLAAASLIASGTESPQLRDLLVSLLSDVPARLADAGAASDASKAERLLLRLIRSPEDVDAPGANLEIIATATAVAALRAIAEKYPALLVLPEAYASAATWGRPNITKLLKTLEGLGAAAQQFLKNPAADGYKELEKVPCKFAKNVSPSALQEYPSDYFLTDAEGTEIQLGPHFVVGSGDNVCRIYLAVDKQRRRYIIGHVGDHLRDASNP